jgi:hypothetical protein
MCKIVNAGSAAALLLCQAACAIAPPPPPVITLGDKEITVADRRVGTVSEMLAVMAENKMTAVTVRPLPEASYEQVGKVIYAIFRSGAQVTTVVVPVVQQGSR